MFVQNDLNAHFPLKKEKKGIFWVCAFRVNVFAGHLYLTQNVEMESHWFIGQYEQRPDWMEYSVTLVKTV